MLTNTRPPSASEHVQIPPPPRSNGSYSHTPSPVPAQAPQQNTQRTNISGQYHQDYVNNQNYATPATTPTGSVDNTGTMSRPSSVNSQVNVPTSNQNYQAQTNSGFTAVSSANFSPNSNNAATSNFTNSGNGKPGYPQVNSHPQLVSHNSSGYPGDHQYGGTQDNNTEPNATHQWSHAHDSMMWEPQHQQNLNESAKNEQSNITTKDYEQQQHQQHHDNKPPDQNDEQYNNRVNINSRIKTMILNKSQQSIDNKDSEHDEHKTGHFLSYSHHRHHQYNYLDDDGGLFNQNNHSNQFSINLQNFKSNTEQEYQQQQHQQQEELQYAVNNGSSKNGWTYAKKSEIQTKDQQQKQQKQLQSFTNQNSQTNQIQNYNDNQTFQFNNPSRNILHNQNQYQQQHAANHAILHAQPPGTKMFPDNTIGANNWNPPSKILNTTSPKPSRFPDKTIKTFPINNPSTMNWNAVNQQERGFQEKFQNPENNNKSKIDKVRRSLFDDPKFNCLKNTQQTFNTNPPPQSWKPATTNSNFNQAKEVINNFKPNTNVTHQNFNWNQQTYQDNFTNYVNNKTIEPSNCSNLIDTLKKPKKERNNNRNKRDDNNKKKNNNNVGTDIPKCSCFPPDRLPPPEPGSYYTHLGKIYFLYI